ncbi:MAG: ECF transporter S component [Clostridiales bacterium]|nr:ECF transporter S component [Clostridiales bacterium]
MLENVLIKKNCSLKVKLTVKSLVSLGLVALAVALPQIVHAALGAPGGVQWLPMYLPVLLGGCLLGSLWGISIGVASPVVSFLITLAAGNPMPMAARLPFMAAELAVFGAVSGLFANKIAQNGWLAFPAVLLAQIAGRTAFMLLVLIFQAVTPFTPAVIWAQIQTGLLGMVLQAALVPFIVMGLKLLLDRDKNQND